MEDYHLYDRRPIPKSKAPPPPVKWFKEWVPQDVVSTGGKCSLLKWVTEDMLKALKDKQNVPERDETEPEPTTEVLFLCSYDGCGKTFIDAGALRKHAHIHGERQYVCHYEGCDKRFLDSSKLKRHFLIHTGEKSFFCTHEGCGKAFSLDFNLRAHMRTHSQENYHVCPYKDCGKRYAHEYKLKSHIKSHHEKNRAFDAVKQQTPILQKTPVAAKPLPVVYGSASSGRPYSCPYEGCDKSYIHEYKLNLHLRREHPGHNPEDNNGRNASEAHNDMDYGSDRDVYARRNGNGNSKRLKTMSITKTQPAKVPQSKIRQPNMTPMNLNVTRKQWPIRDMHEEEDSEETEEDRDDVEEGGWRYAENNNDEDDDDEETEYED